MWRGSVVFNGRVFMWVLAMALLALGLASLAAPVFAQVSVVSQESDQFGVVDESICSQVYSAAVQQYNAGDQNANANADAGAVANVGATADAGGDAAAAAVADADAVNIANVTGLDVSTVNACLNDLAEERVEKPTKGPATTSRLDTTSPLDTTDRTVAADVIIETIPDQKVLADTGGPVVLLPALGLLLVTAGATVLRVLLRS